LLRKNKSCINIFKKKSEFRSLKIGHVQLVCSLKKSELRGLSSLLVLEDNMLKGNRGSAQLTYWEVFILGCDHRSNTLTLQFSISKMGHVQLTCYLFSFIVHKKKRIKNLKLSFFCYIRYDCYGIATISLIANLG
jgi:hypothetical protein